MSRSTRYLSALILLGIVAIPISAVKAQVHFDNCVSLTGGNANIVVPASSHPTINGAPLESGDEIAVFTPEGLCGGSASWTGSNLSITAWVDDSITPVTDGFVAGDAITYKVWDASADVELAAQEVSYSSEHAFYRTDGKFGQNSIYAVSAFTATAGGSEPVAPMLALPTEFATDVPLTLTLEWQYPSEGVSYDLQVSTDAEFSSLIVDEDGLDTTSYAYAGLSHSSTYYWRVRAWNESGYGAYSQIWSFTTVDPMDVPAPSAAHDHVSTQEDTEVEVNVLANDTNLGSGALTIEIARNPARGTARIQNSSIIYTPDTDFNGQDTLWYRLQNSTGGTSSARVVVAISPVDDAPYFPEESAITNPSSGEEILIGRLSIDGDTSETAHFLVEWSEAIDVDGDLITYMWELSATQDFSEPLLRIDAGVEPQIETDHSSISGILREMEISVGSAYTFYHRVVATSTEQSVMSDAQGVRLVRGTMTRTDDGTQPKQFTLDQNYPNPFNPSTTIAYTLAEEAFVTLTVYDVVGREVATLVADRQPSGEHSVAFEADRLNSGVYAYRIEAGSHTAIRSMVLLK
jgi:hypothetical protein